MDAVSLLVAIDDADLLTQPNRILFQNPGCYRRKVCLLFAAREAFVAVVCCLVRRIEKTDIHVEACLRGLRLAYHRPGAFLWSFFNSSLPFLPAAMQKLMLMGTTKLQVAVSRPYAPSTGRFLLVVFRVSAESFCPSPLSFCLPLKETHQSSSFDFLAKYLNYTTTLNFQINIYSKMILKSSSIAFLLLPVAHGFTAPKAATSTTKLDAGRTLYDKIFEDHTVTESDGSSLL